MAVYTTYEQVGKKEDVSDIISNISPTKTPFQSAIGSDKVDNTLFQWQEDSLRSVQDNAKAEGADAADIVVVPTVMRNNQTQILTRDREDLGLCGAHVHLWPRQGKRVPAREDLGCAEARP
jgi:hypothetical protein